MTRPNRGSLVLVEWADTWSLSSGWHSRKAARRMKPFRISSVGFVVRSTAKRLALVANVATGNQSDRPCSGITVIPWGSVRSVKLLAN